MILCITESAAYGEAALSRLCASLPPERRAYAERARHPAMRASRILGYALLAYAARLLLPDVRLGDLLIGECGKPRLPDPRLTFSLSHTASAVAVAVASAGTELGLDLETLRPLRPALLRSFASEDELARVTNASDPDRAAIALWTEKEAEAKRSGYGIGQDLRSIRAQGSATAWLSLGGVQHALTLTPCTELPEIRQISPEELLSGI